MTFQVSSFQMWPFVSYLVKWELLFLIKKFKEKNKRIPKHHPKLS